MKNDIPALPGIERIVRAVHDQHRHGALLRRRRHVVRCRNTRGYGRIRPREVRAFERQPQGQRCRTGYSLETLESRQLLALVPLAPIAADDEYQVQEDQILVGNLVAGTPAGGADSSAKPTLPLQVIAINGQPTVGGSALALDSGATLEIAADGSFSYDPSTSPTLR